MDSCDVRLTAYKGGRSFRECRDAAAALIPTLASRIDESGGMTWDAIMEESEYDAVVYKLALKYLRQNGYDIGSHARQSVRPA